MVATPDRSQGLLVTHRAELVRNPVLNHPYAIRVHTSVGDERRPAYPGDSDDQLRILESGVQLSTIAHACHRVAHAAWEDERDDIVDSCHHWDCLLYTSDAADDLLCVDLGGRRIIKKKK